MGATSRETIVCNRSTVEAAITTGSMLACGIEPCAPRPNMRISKLSPAEVTTPDRLAMTPADIGITCWPRITSGFGKALEQPVVDHRLRARAVSSAGWKTAISVPCQASLSAARARRARQPGHVHVMAAGVHHRRLVPSHRSPSPCWHTAAPSASLTGSASMSARSITVGPSPFFSSPTTPVPPTPSVTSNRRRVQPLRGQCRRCASPAATAPDGCGCPCTAPPGHPAASREPPENRVTRRSITHGHSLGEGERRTYRGGWLDIGCRSKKTDTCKGSNVRAVSRLGKTEFRRGPGLVAEVWGFGLGDCRPAGPATEAQRAARAGVCALPPTVDEPYRLPIGT